MMTPTDPLAFFRLKQIRVARVSEISEATAAAPVPPEERVNFHIGNPLQDVKLSSAFLRIALGIDVRRQDLADADADALLEHLGWDSADKPKLEFLIRTIQKSTPYMPRGGYNRKAPHALVKAFSQVAGKPAGTLAVRPGREIGQARNHSRFGGDQRDAARDLIGHLQLFADHASAHLVLPLRISRAVQHHPQPAD